MKIKLDENMPESLGTQLGELGHDVHTVPSESLSGATDGEIWAAASSEQRFLITQDLDFSDARRFAPGTHAGILLVRLRSPGRKALAQAVANAFASEDVSSWQGCFVVLTERKIRIQRP